MQDAAPRLAQLGFSAFSREPPLLRASIPCAMLEAFNELIGAAGKFLYICIGMDGQSCNEALEGGERLLPMQAISMDELAGGRRSSLSFFCSSGSLAGPILIFAFLLCFIDDTPLFQSA